MLSNIKIYALVVLGFMASVFGMLFYRQKAKHEAALKRGSEEAREVENDATDAMVEGLKNEAKVNQNIGNPNRNYFKRK